MGVMSSGDSQSDRSIRNYGLYLVAFIDLLGQRNEVDKLRPLSMKNDQERIRNIVEKNVKTILDFRNDFEATFRAIFHDDDAFREDFALGLEGSQRDEFLALTEPPPLRQVGFSDCIVMAIPMYRRNFREIQNVKALHAALYGLAHVSLVSLSDGVPVRAGIQVQYAVELSSNEVYGEALVDAYVLESSVAEYPRTVIGRSLIDYLDQVERLPESEYAERERDLVAECRKLIIKAPDDGLPMLHILENGALEGNRSKAVTSYYWVQRRQREFQDAGNDKLAGRYHRLLLYFDTVLWNKSS